MIGAVFSILAGIGGAVVSLFTGTTEQLEVMNERQWKEAHTDPDLQLHYALMTGDPSKYEEIWNKIEEYKRNGGINSHRYAEAWKDVGTYRLTFCNSKGVPTQAYQGNREHGVRLLMMSDGLLTTYMASGQNPYQKQREDRYNRRLHW